MKQFSELARIQPGRRPRAGVTLRPVLGVWLPPAILSRVGEERDRVRSVEGHCVRRVRSAPERKPRILSLVLFLLVSAGTGHGAAAAEEVAMLPAGKDAVVAARAPVESLHAVLLGCMKEADALGFQGRYERIAAALDESFDLEFMARMSVGGAWNELDEQQRADFVALSRRYSAANYASNFDGFGGESFETLAEEPAAHGTILVKTELVQPDDQDVAFDYRLRNVDSRWRIIDVQLDGKISELTLRRSDYRSVIRRQGFPHLVGELEKRIEEFAAK
jgi:phospholipid transport system substrate-binding protein